MKMSYDDTRRFLEVALRHPEESARATVYLQLKRENFTEAQFFVGIVDHLRGLGFNSAQWFELLKRFRNRVLWSQLEIDSLLSETQITQLPPLP